MIFIIEKSRFWNKNDIELDKTITHVVVGMAPYGDVAVWINSLYKSIVISWGKGQEIEIDNQLLQFEPIANCFIDGDLYLKEHFHVLSKDEYIDIVIKQLEILDPKIIVNRITSDPDKSTLLEPVWLVEKCQLLNDIDKEMKKRNTYQGMNLEYVLFN